MLAAWTAATEAALRISDEVRSAEATGTPARIRGSGLWLDAGAPVHADGTISLASDAGILEYVPGDLTITALAGTTLADLNAAVSRNNQWLALDPFGDPRGTIGATIATGSWGPLAHAYGTPRDHLLGVEFVNGMGEIIRGGGRVTKNVAGFDLSRLVCGSWGTLGVITEVTLRLRGRPERDITAALPLPDSDAAAPAELLRAIRESGVTPVACELLDGGMCRAAGLEMNGALAMRFSSNEAGVEAQLRRLQKVAPAEQCEPGVWTRICRSDRFDHMVVRISSRPSLLPGLWQFVRAATSRLEGARASATVGRGVVRWSVPFQFQETFASLAQSRPQSAMICERLPASLWPELAPPFELSDRLTARTRDVFDPRRILNPGILGEIPA
jgi:glycolate oxidase FAD binding subunit